MINVVTFETAHLFGKTVPDIHRLRYREFIERQRYDVPVFKDMEYDRYDTPVAVHIAWRDDSGQVRGAIRISPTSYPYMIKDLWPEIVESCPLPDTDKVWEATRMCIDRTLPVEMRDSIHVGLILAMLDFALRNGIEAYIGVAPAALWKYTFIRHGWPIEFLGATHVVENGEKVRAAIGLASQETMESVKCTSGHLATTANNIIYG
jgi:N-acyl-L-homoserine lactone synthetase